MELRLTTIATYATPEEAEVARAALEEEGISVCLENASTLGMTWVLSNAVGGVKLQVPEEDEQRACEILAEFEADDTQRDSEATCGRCGATVPAGFDVCWSCGSELGVESPQIAPPPTKQAAVVPEAPEETEDAMAPGDELARRAFHAGILGLFICPLLLSLYSIWILLCLAASGQPLSRRGKRHCVIAVLADSLVCFSVGWLLAVHW